MGQAEQAQVSPVALGVTTSAPSQCLLGAWRCTFLWGWWPGPGCSAGIPWGHIRTGVQHPSAGAAPQGPLGPEGGQGTVPTVEGPGTQCGDKAGRAGNAPLTP